MRIAAAEIAPVLLDREATLAKVLDSCQRAAADGVRLVAFPEAVVPGYPTWLEHTNAAAFDDPLQKQIHARYLEAGVELPGPVLDALLEATADLGLTAIVGVMERGRAEGRGSLWATALTVHPDGTWCAHRKLVPTHEERLAWAPGDGHGLRVHEVAGWRVGVLNCWENWMPAARMALYAQGEELHVSLWPGTPANTLDISRFTAREGRVYVLAASGLLRVEDVPDDFPARDALVAVAREGVLRSGGSRVTAPDGSETAFLAEPVEGLLVADLDRALLLGERQNFDAAGHYHRKDVFQLHVDRRRRDVLELRDE